MPDRSILVAAGLVLFVGAALLKPWQPEPAVPRTAVAPVALQEATSSPLRQQPAPPPGVVTADRTALRAPLRWNEVEPTIVDHDGWGVRAIVAREWRQHAWRTDGSEVMVSGGIAIRERWAPAEPTAAELLSFRDNGRQRVWDAVVMPSNSFIAALGITSPASESVLDVRTWRIGREGLPQRLPVRRVAGGPRAGDRLYLPPPEGWAPFGLAGWSAGTYRLDVLLRDRIVRIVTVLRGPANPALEDPPSRDWQVSGLALDLALQRLPELPPGPFVVDADAGTLAVQVDAVPRPLDEAGAWRAARRLPEPAGPLVASLESGRPLAFGAKLGPGERIRSASLSRLAPDGREVASGRWAADAATSASPSHAVLVAPTASGWPPGSYRLDVVLDSGSAPDRRVWHIELLGWPHAPTDLLAGALTPRVMQPVAGRRARSRRSGPARVRTCPHPSRAGRR